MCVVTCQRDDGNPCNMLGGGNLGALAAWLTAEANRRNDRGATGRRVPEARSAGRAGRTETSVAGEVCSGLGGTRVLHDLAAGWMASTSGVARKASMVRGPAHASSHTRPRQSTRASTCTPPVSSSPQERIVHRAPPSSSPGLHSRHRTHTDRRWRSPSCRTPCKAAR